MLIYVKNVEGSVFSEWWAKKGYKGIKDYSELVKWLYKNKIEGEQIRLFMNRHFYSKDHSEFYKAMMEEFEIWKVNNG